MEDRVLSAGILTARAALEQSLITETRKRIASVRRVLGECFPTYMIQICAAFPFLNTVFALFLSLDPKSASNSPLFLEDLISFSFQVARGMEYLASRKVWRSLCRVCVCHASPHISYISLSGVFSRAYISVSTETWQPGTFCCRTIRWWKSVTSAWPETSTKTPTMSARETWVRTSNKYVYYLKTVIFILALIVKL